MSKVTLVEQASAPATPAAGRGVVYFKNNKKLAVKDDAGVETELGAGGGGGEANTGANVGGGGGAGVFRDKTGATLNFRSLVAASAALVVTQATDTISLAFGHVLTAALNAANFAVQNIRTATFNGEVDNGNSGAAKTIDWSAGSKQRITMTANCTFTFTNPPGPTSGLFLKVIQDGTGGRTITWPASVRWGNGTPPNVQSGGSNATHVLGLYFDGTNYWGLGSVLSLS